MKRYNARLLPSAHKDLLQARAWYRSISAELPPRFREQVVKSIEAIKANPFTFAIRYRDVRIANLRVFPYAIHFFVIESTNTVIVIAVHHISMNPELWEGK